MPRFRTVVLDVDGTLVDSNAAHASAWTDALAEQQRDIPFERVRLLIGMGADNLLPTLLGVSSSSDEGSRLAARAGEIFHEKYFPTVKPFARVRALVERIRSDGYRIVIASSAEGDALRRLLKVADVDELIEQRVSSDDVQRSKPEPDAIEAALRKTQTQPSQAIMIGDTPYDVAAALRAGVQIIGLRCGGWDDEQLPGTIATYDDPASLLASYDASPLADGPRADRRRRHSAVTPGESTTERRV